MGAGDKLFPGTGEGTSVQEKKGQNGVRQKESQRDGAEDYWSGDSGAWLASEVHTECLYEREVPGGIAGVSSQGDTLTLT